MKKLTCLTVFCLIFVISGASPVRSQNDVIDEYAILNGPSGPQVCLGKYVPPTDVAMPGFCQGQAADLAQLTAVSSKESAVKLDQIMHVLVSIDERLALNNSQIARLVQASVSSQSSNEQGIRARDILLEAISKRFDTMSGQIKSDDSLRKGLARLKQDILREVEESYSTRAETSAK